MLDVLRGFPFGGVEPWRDWERALPRPEGVAGAPWRPVSDVVETDDAYVITAELPGVSDEDIEITTRGGVLTIAGHRTMQDEVTTDRMHRIERSYGDFARSFRLPDGVAEDDITAKVAYGVLRVEIPKRREPPARRITVAPAG